MIRSALIIAMLGTSSLCAPAFADPNSSAEISAETVENLRSALELASREGWVELSSKPETALEKYQKNKEPIAVENVSNVDCSALDALSETLADSTTYLSKGLLPEAVAAGEIPASSAMVLSDLIGQKWVGNSSGQTDVSFKGSEECGLEYKVWDYLTEPHIFNTPDQHAYLMRSISGLPSVWREAVTIEAGKQAARIGDRAQARRIKNSLEETQTVSSGYAQTNYGLILLDIYLEKETKPDTALEKAKWLADQDVPEQMEAISLIAAMTGHEEAIRRLKPLSVGTRPAVKFTALELMATLELDQGQLGQATDHLIKILQKNNSLPAPVKSKLLASLETGLISPDNMVRIEALDSFYRLESYLADWSLDTTQSLRGLSETALDELGTTADASLTAVSDVSQPLPNMPSAASIKNRKNAEQYIDAFEQDLTMLREVLDNG